MIDEVFEAIGLLYGLCGAFEFSGGGLGRHARCNGPPL